MVNAPKDASFLEQQRAMHEKLGKPVREAGGPKPGFLHSSHCSHFRNARLGISRRSAYNDINQRGDTRRSPVACRTAI